ncbi:hypothetical protein D3C81_1685390 [compost metagenome]
MQHEGRGGIDPQASGRLLPAQGHLLLGLFHLGEDAPRLGQEGLTLLGQLQASGSAAQQGHVEFVLEPAQGAADPRGGLRQLLGSRGDGAGVDHASEGLQLVEGRFHS